MTERELALARYVLEQVKEGKLPSITNSEKVDLDSVAGYFDNILLDVAKVKKGNKDSVIFYKLRVEVRG